MGETLTYQQRQAVEDRGGKLLVSAAAGSGKTKVLVDRLMGYILDEKDPANIDDFLIITYTKAAAAELRSKIAAKLSELIAQRSPNKHLQQQMQRLYLAKISTVHGFCTDILRQYAYRLDISPDFRVADEGECLQLQMKALDQVLNEAYENAKENSDFCAFVDSQGLGRDDRQIPEIVLKVYNSARCHLNPNEWLDWCADGGSVDGTDAGNTPWGQYLMADLKAYLAMQIDAMDHCARIATKTEGMEKPAALFLQTVSQLQALYDSRTWDEIVHNKEIDYGRLTFSKKCSDLQLAEQMKAIRNACKEGLSKRLRSFADESDRVLEDLSASVKAARGLVELVRTFSAEYQRLKKGRAILDFSDLEHKTLDLLLGKQRSGITVIAGEIADRFREVLVDEYQDSNGIQDAIFSALTEKRQNCFMVGDVKQSIYQFRLADPGIFIEKYNAYSSVESARTGEGRKILLSHNFRSSGGVISAVNDVFCQCMSPSVGGLAYGEEEMLREGIPHIPLEEAEVSLFGIDVQSDTYAEEATFVAEKIVELLDGRHYVRDKDTLRPITPEDIVILLRSPGSVGGEFQYALEARGIHSTTGDGSNLLQSDEIATVRAILQIINNPLQDIPLVATLTSPVFGFTAEDLAILRSKDRLSDVYTLLQNATDEKSINFIKTIESLRNCARFTGVTKLLSAIYTQTGLLSIYAAAPDGENRLANLQSFFQIVSDYETAGPKELTRLLEFLDAADQRGLANATAAKSVKAVTIMSIHKSKGLEFPVVFLCGLSRGFNQESAYAQVLCDKDLGLGLGCVDARHRVRYPTVAKRAIATKMIKESISEEMRVLYVAMTRARDRLIMTYALKNLAGNLQKMAMRLDMSSNELLASEADCPGAWVILSALTRTEAGAFFKIAGQPDHTMVSDSPWNISVVQVSGENSSLGNEDDQSQQGISREILDKISAGLRHIYGGARATEIPSKLTATQLKGRTLDTEIADGTDEMRHFTFRKPGPHTETGKTYGNAIHSIMQYIRFSACGDLNSIRQDIHRMVEEQRISHEQAEMADCEKLLAFFSTPLGKKLRNSSNVLREFKFSLLDAADKYYPDAAGEQILLQGVVDCALLEADGITVLDFKTDYVTDQILPTVAGQYIQQVKAYADALERIYQMPVKSAKLYFFCTNQFVDVL